MDRRRFAFWLGFGLFSFAEKFRVSGFDALAAAAMRRTESVRTVTDSRGAEHWTVGGDKEWRWFERENLVKGDWVLTGTTTPIHKSTGVRKSENIAYLDDSLVPADIRTSRPELVDSELIDLVRHDAADDEHAIDLDPQLPTAKARARHGRPPSKWLRSLNADEIRVWLKTVELPEAGVSGMSVWNHLTRDHRFDASRIKGLTEPEQDKLHAAAHYGY